MPAALWLRLTPLESASLEQEPKELKTRNRTDFRESCTIQQFHHIQGAAQVHMKERVSGPRSTEKNKQQALFMRKS